MSPSPASRHAVRAHGREPLLGRPHPLPCPPSPAAALAERVEPGPAAVTLPARHRGLAKAGARVIALETQGAWGRKGAGQQGERGEPGGQGCGAPLTCGVAVAGPAGRRRAPAVEVLLAALTVRPGRVVSAAQATPAVARASEELRVKLALLGVAAAVARCGWEAGVGGHQPPWRVAGGEAVPLSLLVLIGQAARGRSRMGVRPSSIKDMETDRLISPNRTLSRVEAAPFARTPTHRTLPGEPRCPVTWSRTTDWPPSGVAMPLTPRSLVDPLSHSNRVSPVMRHVANTSHPSFTQFTFKNLCPKDGLHLDSEDKPSGGSVNSLNPVPTGKRVACRGWAVRGKAGGRLWDLEGGAHSCPGRVGQALLQEVAALAACEGRAARSWLAEEGRGEVGGSQAAAGQSGGHSVDSQRGWMCLVWTGVGMSCDGPGRGQGRRAV